MSISYEPLWQLLNELNITKMEFAKMIDISNATLAKIGKNEPITLTIVDKICNKFNCKIENVVKHIPNIKIETDFILQKGMIVLLVDMLDMDSTHIKESNQTINTKKRTYVILDIIAQDNKNTPNDHYLYVVAPIYSTTNNTSPFNVPFNGVEIDGKFTKGIVAFGKLSVMDSSLFEKQLGFMPDHYMQKFDKILQALNEIFGEKEN